MEERNMAVPRLTKAGLEAVGPYQQFRRSLDSLLTHARDALVADGTLHGFNARHHKWQEAYGRIGWRLFVGPDVPHFAFMGILHSEGALQAGGPELFFFLETPPASEARKAVNAARGAYEEAMQKLADLKDGTRWTYHEGGFQVVQARRPLAPVLEEADQGKAITAFFRACFLGAQGTGILGRFLDACVGKVGSPAAAG
jgi:hypothetical protein